VSDGGQGRRFLQLIGSHGSPITQIVITAKAGSPAQLEAI
jgi:hypothetical protein